MTDQALNLWQRSSRRIIKGLAALALPFIRRIRPIGNDHFARGKPTYLEPAPSSSKGLVVIVSRACYSEFDKTYPIAARQELQQVLKHEYSGQLAFHCIYNEVEHQRKVKTFVLKTELEQRLPAFGWVLPESLLVHYATQEDVRLLNVNEDEASWFLYHQQGHFISQLKSSICSDVTRFKLMQGVPEKLTAQQLTAKDLPATLLAGIRNIPANHWLNFFYLRRMERIRLPWPGLIVSSILAGGLYFSVVSLYSELMLQHRQEQTVALRQELNQVMALQQQHQSLQQQAGRLQERLQNEHLVYPIWQTLLFLHQQGATLAGAHWQNNEFEFRGQTDRATDLLVSLNALPYISHAEFTTPARRVRNRDQFSIRVRFNLSAGTTSEQQESADVAE